MSEQPKRLEDMTEPELRAQLNLTCSAIKASLPPNTGFVVLAASFDGQTAQYGGNVQRDDAMFWMLETIQRWLKRDYVPRQGE